jgi:hypothetical protein
VTRPLKLKEKATPPQCDGVIATICGDGGVIRIGFDHPILSAGIVASPKRARQFADEILAAVKQAEQD